MLVLLVTYIQSTLHMNNQARQQHHNRKAKRAPLVKHKIYFQKPIVQSKNIRFCYNIIRLSPYPVYFLPQYELLDQINDFRYNILTTSGLNYDKNQQLQV